MKRENRCETITINEDVKIKYSIDPTEFEIQSELYLGINHLCSIVDNHCHVRSEVTINMNGSSFRFDLMLFRYNVPQCGIEVKKRTWKISTPQTKKQTNNYLSFKEETGIPVFYCYGMDQVDEIINEVKKYIY